MSLTHSVSNRSVTICQEQKMTAKRPQTARQDEPPRTLWPAPSPYSLGQFERRTGAHTGHVAPRDPPFAPTLI